MDKYTVTDNEVTEGNLVALARAMETDLRVVDNGIGRGEAAGVPYNDVQLGVEDYNETCTTIELTDMSEETDPELALELLIDKAKIKTTIEFSDDDDIDEDEGRAYVRYKGTGITATFQLQNEIKPTDNPHKFIVKLWYD
jgi:hypothetical protein